MTAKTTELYANIAVSVMFLSPIIVSLPGIVRNRREIRRLKRIRDELLKEGERLEKIMDHYDSQRAN